MAERFDEGAVRTVLELELGRLAEPPIGGLVDDALRAGRRDRRVRTAARAAGAGLGLAAVVLAVVAVPRLLGVGGTSAVPVPPAGPAQAATTVAPSEATTTAQPPTPADATTPPAGRAGVKAALQQEIEAALGDLGLTGTPTYEFFSPKEVAQGSPVVRVVVETGRGPGMFQLSHVPPSDVDEVTADTNPDNCIQSETVLVRSTRSTGMQVDVATCLSWDGTQNPPSVAPLTQEQATRLALRPDLQAALDRAQAALEAAARTSS